MPVSRATRNPRVARHVPELVVPEILGQATRQPQPTYVPCRQPLHVAERAERPPERGQTGRVALGEPRCQAVEEQVDRAWRLRCRRRSQSGIGSFSDARFVAEPTGEHRRRQSLEMGLASHRCVERLEAAGGTATGPERRCRGCGRTRSPRATAPTARAEARRAGPARRWPTTRAPRPMPQHRTSPARQPQPACPSPPDRRSARPRAPGTPQPPPRPHGPAPGRPSAPTRRPPPRQHPPPREHDARPDDRDRCPDRSPPPTPHAQLAARNGGRSVYRGSHQWMPEADTSSDLDQLRVFCRGERAPFDTELVSRAQDERRITDRLGRGQQQQSLRCLGSSPARWR